MHTVVGIADVSPPGRTARHGGGRTRGVLSYIAANPDAGDLIKGSGGCRKVRFAGKGKGKSGAFRMITFFASESIPVFLLTVYAKDRLKTLSDAQVNAMKLVVKAIAGEYQRKKGQ